jgi:hypothetical protein
MDKYENDVHNCTNQQLADLLDEIANGAESGMKQIELDEEIIEIAKQDIKILREAAKRLRIPPHPTFHEEYMGECL